MDNLSNDGIQWFCGTVTPTTFGTNTRRRLLQVGLEPQPTATVTMYTVGNGVVNNRSAANDFNSNITTSPAAVNGIYTTQLANAYIVVNSVQLVVGSGGGTSLSGGGGGSGLTNGQIAGIVVGSVVGGLLLLCCLCALCFLLGARRDRDVSEPSSAEASRKEAVRPPIAAGAFGPAAGAGLAGAATTAPDLSGEESVYQSYHTPPPADREPEVSEVDPDQSSQLHIHV